MRGALSLALLCISMFGGGPVAWGTSDKPKCAALTSERNTLLPLSLREAASLYAPFYGRPQSQEALDHLVTRYLEQNVLPGPGAPRDLLTYGRELLDLSDHSLPGSLLLQEAVISRLEKLDGEPQQIAALMKHARILRELAVEAVPANASPQSIRKLLGEKLLSSPEISAPQKALYIYLMMGTADWQGRRILQSVPISERENVEALLAQRLPLWRVYKELARRNRVHNYPLDFAIAESLRDLPIPASRNWLAQTTETNLLFSATGYWGYFKSGRHYYGTRLQDSQEQLIQNANLPAVGMPYDLALAHVNRLTQVAQDLGLGMSFEIPSARMLEAANMAGVRSRFFFGDREGDLPLFANFTKKVRPAHEGPSNPAGFRNIIGNIRVWTDTELEPDSAYHRTFFKGHREDALYEPTYSQDIRLGGSTVGFRRARGK